MESPPFPRRNFLKAGSLAAAAAFSPPLVAAPSLATQIAVKYTMIRENLSIMDKFKMLKDIGFDGVEVYPQHAPDRAEFLKATESTGVRIHGVVNSSKPEIAESVELASYLGGNAVLLLARVDEEKSYEENVKHWQKLIRRAIPTAETRNIQLLIENVRATFLKTAEGMAEFIDSFDNPVVGSYFDTGNTITWTEQSAEHWADVLGDRIEKLDIKDRGHPEFGDAKLASQTAQGTDGGEVNWKAVRKELGEINFDGWATAEVTGGDRERLARIADWMNRVLRRP